ncbi:MAG TPA: molybdopterin-guanine dinucleotide biosynthesis protein B [Methanocorpusculum sp.]|nr:molybdopterin-guanine dinucleotide biosynthesis protein B [Methanocorpusculum sp.]
MRIISIVGHSNSGKTTLVTRLVPELAKIAQVATIKHLGHHTFALPDGKDTTLHYNAGALCGAGIDGEKTVITLRDTDVFTILDFYAFMRYDYVVIEGFKELGYPCVALGDLYPEKELLHDPSVEEILKIRYSFAVYEPRKR